MEKLRDESCLAVAFHGSNNIRLTHNRVNWITESAVQSSCYLIVVISYQYV